MYEYIRCVPMTSTPAAWKEVVAYLNKVYLPCDPKDEDYEETIVDSATIYDDLSKHVHLGLSIGTTWRGFEGFCSRKRVNFCTAAATKGTTSIKRKLYILKAAKREKIKFGILNVLRNHQLKIEEMKDENIEIVGYARKSPGKEERQRRLKNLQNMARILLRHSKCDQVFVSPSSQSSQSMNDRDHDTEFVGNTEDMLAYVTTTNNDLCLVILDYAGLCSRGALVKSFLTEHSNIKKVVIDMFNSDHALIIMDSSDIINDPGKFETCRMKYKNRSV